MMNIIPALSMFSLLLCFASANAFSKAFQSTGFYKSMTVTMSALKSTSKYNSREAEVFISDIERILTLGTVPLNDRQFLINGWRWHTASALRDLERYSIVIRKIEATCDMDKLDEENSQVSIKNRVVSCYNYVCDYNLKALMKIESELFFPWLQRLLPSASRPLMSEIIEEQAEAKEISKEIGQLCKSLSGDKDDIFLIKKIGLKVREIQKSYLKIQNVQVKTSLQICSLQKNPPPTFDSRFRRIYLIRFFFLTGDNICSLYNGVYFKERTGAVQQRSHFELRIH